MAGKHGEEHGPSGDIEASIGNRIGVAAFMVGLGITLALVKSTVEPPENPYVQILHDSHANNQELSKASVVQIARIMEAGK